MWCSCPYVHQGQSQLGVDCQKVILRCHRAVERQIIIGGFFQSNVERIQHLLFVSITDSCIQPVMTV